MKNKNDILNELKEVAPLLAGLDKINFYRVEEGYFDSVQINIIGLVEKQVAQEALPAVFAHIEKKQLYAAPAATYFTALADDLITEIHAEEVAEELSYTLPLLQGVKKAEHYKVPALYFEKLPEVITRLVSQEAVLHTSPIEEWSSKWSVFAEKVFSVFSRPRYSFGVASVVGLIMLSTLLLNNKGLSKEDKIFVQMQQLSDADLHHYIAKHGDEFDERTVLHDINNVEFTHYFDKPEQVTPHIESHITGTKDKEEDTTNEDILD